jgi:hypothetical protein
MMDVTIIGDDTIILDLLAHFLGIATHDNINAAPGASTFASVAERGVEPCVEPPDAMPSDPITMTEAAQREPNTGSHPDPQVGRPGTAEIAKVAVLWRTLQQPDIHAASQNATRVPDLAEVVRLTPRKPGGSAKAQGRR